MEQVKEVQIRTPHAVAEALDDHGTPTAHSRAEDLLDANKLDDEDVVDLLIAGIRLQKVLLLVVRGPAAFGRIASDDAVRRGVLLVEVVVL